MEAKVSDSITAGNDLNDKVPIQDNNDDKDHEDNDSENDTENAGNNDVNKKAEDGDSDKNIKEMANTADVKSETQDERKTEESGEVREVEEVAEGEEGGEAEDEFNDELHMMLADLEKEHKETPSPQSTPVNSLVDNSERLLEESHIDENSSSGTVNQLSRKRSFDNALSATLDVEADDHIEIKTEPDGFIQDKKVKLN